MIANALQTYLDQCFAGPVLPSTVLVILVVIYGVLVLLGALDFDLLDLDFDASVDTDPTSAGFMAIKFLNLGDVPLMIWLCTFCLCWWMTSMVFWVGWDQAGYVASGPAAARLIVRNLGVGLLVTKFATDPLTRVFAKQVPVTPRDMIGQICAITTYEATPEFGQASLKAAAAPVLLNVKTTGATLHKGDRARLVAYDPDARIYLVEPVGDSSHEQSPPPPTTTEPP
jgi:hypothetical protein